MGSERGVKETIPLPTHLSPSLPSHYSLTPFSLHLNNKDMTPNKETINSAVVNCLRNIYDPEIPVNIYDLGLIYKVDVDDDLNVKILMTMTAPDCPEAEYMFQEVKQMVSYISGVKSVDVELTFDPPWSMDMIPDDIKVELGFM